MKIDHITTAIPKQLRAGRKPFKKIEELNLSEDTVRTRVNKHIAKCTLNIP